MSYIVHIGNLTGDPELKFTPSGAAVVSFTVASTPRVKQNGEWTDGEPLFLRCSLWNAHAENVAETLKRGMRVTVTGKLKARSYTTREGDKRTAFEIDAEEVGPSLKFATAHVEKVSGNSSGRPAVAAHIDDTDEAPF
jgi:single-strand DNA-binding protein